MEDDALTIPVQRIVSGGQTGVDRGALDAALELGVEHGGWCPLGRIAEDGFIPTRYALRQTESSQYAVRTERNVADSDATLILYHGRLSGGTELTYQFCRRRHRPYLTINLGKPWLASAVKHWLRRNAVRVLNVAGPRESTRPGIQAEAHQALVRIFREE